MTIFARTISAFVRVPVLSVKIIVVDPSVSAARRFRTSPPRFSIASIPIANTTVTAAGNPSGIAATAIAIDIRSISVSDSPRNNPRIKIIINVPRMIYERRRARCTIFSCNGVLRPCSAESDVAILPIFV